MTVAMKKQPDASTRHSRMGIVQQVAKTVLAAVIAWQGKRIRLHFSRRAFCTWGSSGKIFGRDRQDGG